MLPYGLKISNPLRLPGDLWVSEGNLPAVYGNDLGSGYDLTPTLTSSKTLVSFTGVSGDSRLVITQVTPVTIRFRVSENLHDGEAFRFTDGEKISIIGWDQPPEKIIGVHVEWVLVYDETPEDGGQTIRKTETGSTFQTAYWNWVPSLNRFQIDVLASER